MTNRTGIIYKYTCLDTGKSYIGKTIMPKIRHKTHITSNDNSHFHRALRKYSNWSYQVLEDDIPEEELNESEIFYIEMFDTCNNGYNMTKGGDGGSMMYISDETRKKIGDANRGKKHSDETKRKIADNNRKRIITEESKIKNKLSHLGKKHTVESKTKMSNSLKGLKRNYHPINELNGMFGKHHSEESKEKMRIAALNRKPVSEETRMKLNVCKGRHRQYNDPNDHSKGWKMVY